MWYCCWSRVDDTQLRSKAIPVDLSPWLKESDSVDARDCILPMGETSERVAEQWDISRERQDQFAAESHRKAEAAQQDGRLASEIEPIEVRWIDPETGKKARSSSAKMKAFDQEPPLSRSPSSNLSYEQMAVAPRKLFPSQRWSRRSPLSPDVTLPKPPAWKFSAAG